MSTLKRIEMLCEKLGLSFEPTQNKLNAFYEIYINGKFYKADTLQGIENAIKNNVKPIAYGAGTASAFGGLGIYNIVYGIENYVIYKWTDTNRFYKSKINYTTNCEKAFFKNGSQRVYLDECMSI